MKLTEEQLKRLKNLNNSKVNEILGITTLVVGIWYKYIRGNKIHGLLTYNNGKKASGFWDEDYKENYWAFSPDGDIVKGAIPATKEEIEEALIKEAKKRGFENVGDLSLILPDGRNFKKGFYETLNNKFDFFSVYNILLSLIHI